MTCFFETERICNKKKEVSVSDLPAYLATFSNLNLRWCARIVSQGRHSSGRRLATWAPPACCSCSFPLSSFLLNVIVRVTPLVIYNNLYPNYTKVHTSLAMVCMRTYFWWDSRPNTDGFCLAIRYSEI